MEEGTTTLIGRALGGQFEVLGKIGQGGMGAVYKARDNSLDRLVAVKVLTCAAPDDDVSVERFSREAKALAKLSHANLIHVYQVGIEGNLHYFAMEYLPGETLSARLRRAGPLRTDHAGRYLGQVLSALHHIHMAGLVHRDLKAGNIMLADERRAVLMDFGLAKDVSQSGLTSAGVVLGTPDYMAPEQAEGADQDMRADIYSFGIVLYEVLVGRVPFSGKSAIAVLRQHIDSPVPVLESAWPEAPSALAAVIRRCLQKRPDDRYSNIPCLAIDLAAHWPTPEIVELAGAASGQTAVTLVRPGPSSASSASAGTGAAPAAAPRDYPALATEPTIVQAKLVSPAPPEKTKRRAAMWVVAGMLLAAVLVFTGIAIGRALRRAPSDKARATWRYDKAARKLTLTDLTRDGRTIKTRTISPDDVVLAETADGKKVRAVWSFDKTKKTVTVTTLGEDGEAVDSKPIPLNEMHLNFRELTPTPPEDLFGKTEKTP